MKRTVITGMGGIAALGADKDTLFKALIDGDDGIAPIEAFDTGLYRFKTGGEVRKLETITSFNGMNTGKIDRGALLLLAAVHEAICDSGILESGVAADRISLISGTTLGGMVSAEKFYREITADPASVRPGRLRYASQNAANDFVMSRYGFHGHSAVISTACSASAHAIGYGAELIEAGLADVVLAGGFDPMSELTFSGFGILRALTADKIRPFDSKRSGLVLGEGAGILVLEDRAHAKKRGARIYAQLSGYGSSSDALHMTAPHPDGEGARQAMAMALEDAGLAPENIGYINAHGTGTPVNDYAETTAIKSLFRDHAYRVPISSTKSMIGHLLGGAGAIEAVISVMSLVHQQVPPTINYENVDAKCDLDYTPNESRAVSLSAVMSNSFGFGGNNAALVFSAIH